MYTVHVHVPSNLFCLLEQFCFKLLNFHFKPDFGMTVIDCCVLYMYMYMYYLHVHVYDCNAHGSVQVRHTHTYTYTKLTCQHSLALALPSVQTEEIDWLCPSCKQNIYMYTVSIKHQSFVNIVHHTCTCTCRLVINSAMYLLCN